MKKEKICIASDHAGYLLKEELKELLQSMNFEVEDMGTFSANSVDYPDFAHPLAQKVSSGEYKRAVVICGSGNGVNMVVNKYPNVRGALCWNEEIASLARKHNDANVLSLPARYIDQESAFSIVLAFLNTDFEGGRHELRIEKINRK
jgi:ribose 5-phosphate isomerase B